MIHVIFGPVSLTRYQFTTRMGSVSPCLYDRCQVCNLSQRLLQPNIILIHINYITLPLDAHARSHSPASGHPPSCSAPHKRSRLLPATSPPPGHAAAFSLPPPTSPLPHRPSDSHPRRRQLLSDANAIDIRLQTLIGREPGGCLELDERRPSQRQLVVTTRSPP